MAHGGVVSIPEFKLKYSDVFSLRNLYLTMHEMLLEEGWLGPDGDPEHADIEKLYSENVYQRGIHRGGKEIWIWWRAEKFPEGKYSSYFKNFLDIDAHIVYLQNVEVVHQGKKMNVQKGEIEMFFRPRIEMDWQHQWEKHWFMKHIKPIYEKRIVHAEIDKMEKELWRDSYRVHAKLKQYLNLKNFVPVAEPFFARQFGYEE
ncbi:MAG TPA: hypothetical protein VJI97_04530 [Candidatus Nanoarchaeia archaeon]|nr:hypothetical protein [Candidatus Nanoarchaeia archaeon]